MWTLALIVVRLTGTAATRLWLNFKLSGRLFLKEKFKITCDLLRQISCPYSNPGSERPTSVKRNLTGDVDTQWWLLGFRQPSILQFIEGISEFLSVSQGEFVEQPPYGLSPVLSSDAWTFWREPTHKLGRFTGALDKIKRWRKKYIEIKLKSSVCPLQLTSVQACDNTADRLLYNSDIVSCKQLASTDSIEHDPCRD